MQVLQQLATRTIYPHLQITLSHHRPVQDETNRRRLVQLDETTLIAALLKSGPTEV